eukprot:2494415-Rhodomonas_salina.2
MRRDHRRKPTILERCAGCLDRVSGVSCALCDAGILMRGMLRTGTMYNGDQVLVETGKPFATGDEVTVTLDGDAVFFSINGEEIAGPRPLLHHLSVLFCTYMCPVLYRSMPSCVPLRAGSAASCADVAAAARAGSIRPVTGSLRLSVSMKNTGDAVSFVSEEVKEFSSDDSSSSYGTATLSR